ncbi:MAG TPA: VOC family protein [Bacillota bacterium]|nr:VOC family protein [Bacillota bacterium]
MEVTKKSLFQFVDCIELYVPNLQDGIDYYCTSLGLKVLWKTDTAIGLGMDDKTTEVLIQNERNQQIVDFKVNSVIDAVVAIEKAGGQILYGPFDFKVGKCAVVKDPWDNKYVILDHTKGMLITDDAGNIIGQNTPS